MRTRKNALFMMAYEMFVFLIPLVTAPYIARVLGTVGTGEYSYTHSIASYFVVCIQLGVSLYGRREIALAKSKEERAAIFWSIFSITTCLFAVTFPVYILCCLGNKAYTVSLLCQSFLLIGAWLDISWFFFGIEKFAIAVSRNIVLKVISLVLIFAFVKNDGDTVTYISILSVSSFAGVAVMWFSLRKEVEKVSISFKDIQKHIKPLVMMAIPVLSAQIFSLTDKVLLGYMGDIGSVGIYENAFRISRVPVTVIATLGTVLLPRITSMVSNGLQKEADVYIEKSLSITMAIGSAMAFGLVSVAPSFLVLYLGDDFSAGIPILQMLSLNLVIISFGTVFRHLYILPQKLDSIYITSVVGAAVMNVFLNVLMIPKFGGAGAAFASLISELSILLYQSYKIRKHFYFPRLIHDNVKYVASGILMGVCVLLTGRIQNRISWVNLCVQVVVGMVTYLVFSVTLEWLTNRPVIVLEIKKAYKNMRDRGAR